MIILAIDPGTTQSAWVLCENTNILLHKKEDNDRVMLLAVREAFDLDRVVIERFEARGMPIADNSIETILWTGRFYQAWLSCGFYPIFIRRSEVKLYWCGTCRAKDSNVRQAVIDRLGEPGTKKSPGATYGIKADEWQALALAVYYLQNK